MAAASWNFEILDCAWLLQCVSVSEIVVQGPLCALENKLDNC